VKGIEIGMKLSWWSVSLVWLLVIACNPVSTPEAPSTPVAASSSVPSSSRDLSVPGGGRILFLPSEAPGYSSHGIGILEADGSIRRFPAGSNTFPYWDPAALDRLLTLSHGDRPRARSFQIVGDSLHLVGAWRTSETFTFPSADGESIAYTPIDRSGLLRNDVLRLVDRSTSTGTSIRTGGLVPLSWAPGGRLLAEPLTGGDLVLWDPVTGATRPFGAGRFSAVVWAPGGDRFAAAIGRGGPNPWGAVVIGGPGGRIVDRLSLGRRWVEMPTWSPDGSRIAFIVRGPGRTGHRTASLHVYDVARRLDSVAAHPVSDAHWASWSPDGRWLLVADWTSNRWLFVAADGSERIAYPWLGGFPRWCCPSSPPISVPIPRS
jgi:hypothetical protein